MIRNFGDLWLTRAVFLDAAKAFHVVRFDGIIYKLTVLNIPPYLVKTLSSYLRGRSFETSFLLGMRTGVAHSEFILPCLLQSVCQ
jgi:hypothetical protein